MPHRTIVTELEEVKAPTRGHKTNSSAVQLASSLRVVMTLLVRRLRSERTDGSLPLSHLSALTALNRYGPLSPTALAQQERIRPPTTTQIIAALEARGLVAREPHESDGRQSVITVTDAGRQVIADDRARREAWLGRALGTLTEAERELLLTALPILERIAHF